jgi:hypothetical protein
MLAEWFKTCFGTMLHNRKPEGIRGIATISK